eukprot:15221167-Ditylum_brightwellii.AAC.1
MTSSKSGATAGITMQGEAPLVSRTAPQILCQATLPSGEVLSIGTEASLTDATECANAAGSCPWG